MKVQAHQEQPPTQFRPIQLNITLESQAELDALYTLSQYCPITDALNRIALPDPLSSTLYHALQKFAPKSCTVEYEEALKRLLRG